MLLAVKKWHSYLVGRPFVIKMDHQSLKFLLEQQAITPYQQKWVAKMLGYDYSIVYRKGAQNAMADALSRKHLELGHQLLQCEGSQESDWSAIWERILSLYETDQKLSRLYDQVRASRSCILNIRGMAPFYVGRTKWWLTRMQHCEDRFLTSSMIIP